MKNLIDRFGIHLVLLGVLFLTIVALAPRAEAIQPCFGITAIDAAPGAPRAARPRNRERLISPSELDQNKKGGNQNERYNEIQVSCFCF